MSYFPPDPLLLKRSGWQSLKVILHGTPPPERWKRLVLFLERVLWL